MCVREHELVTALRAQKLLVVPAGDNTVRLLPPLNITRDDMRTGIEALEQACAQLRDQKPELCDDAAAFPRFG